MVFSSVTFLIIFLPLTAVLYYLPLIFLHPKATANGKKSIDVTVYKNSLLCVASLFFYAWGEPVNIALMLISIIFNYAIGRDIGIHREKTIHKKLLFTTAVIFNIGLLGFFKYSGFISENICALTGKENTFPEIALPIGISFYTFQILSYIIDVYKNRVSTQKSLVNFALYISMFPQLIAGPIVQYSTIEAQLKKRNESCELVSKGIYLFCIGLAKKVIFANTAGAVYEKYLAIGFDRLSFLGAWSAIIFYAFQIYFDFSGYSDMAKGLGYMFGFEFPENFRYPYMADSITDFWRRWHITLSSWFRDYVYIPLGGSRCSVLRTFFNLFAVWFLTGLWHGASWNFVIWGLYYFVLLVLEKFVLKNKLEKMSKPLRHAVTLILILIGWVIFANEDMTALTGFLKCLLGFNGIAESSSAYLLYSNILMLIAMAVFSTDLFDIKENRKKMNKALKYILTFIMFAVSIVFLIGDTYNPFLYFRF